MHDEIVNKIEQAKQIIYAIEHKEKQMSSKELMDGLNFVKDVLIKPYYNENNEGRKIRYVIDLKDNFLQGSNLVKDQADIDLLREWLKNEVLVTELLYRGSKDGFQAATFHAKCDGKGPTLGIIKSKTGQLFGFYVSINWNTAGGY